MTTATKSFGGTYAELTIELTNRGEDPKSADLFGWLKGCWPTDSTVGDLADDWQEMDASNQAD